MLRQIKANRRDLYGEWLLSRGRLLFPHVSLQSPGRGLARPTRSSWSQIRICLRPARTSFGASRLIRGTRRKFFLRLSRARYRVEATG
jgi:hypothetical protein